LLKVIIFLLSPGRSKNMDAIEFGKYLRKLRKQRGLTMKELGELTNLSQPYISQIETAQKGIPSPEVLYKLAKPLGVYHSHLMYKAGLIKDENVLETDYESALYEEDTQLWNAKMKELEHKANNIINILYRPEVHLNSSPLSKEDRNKIINMLYILFPEKIHK
jgi:transcriptional regulator with XRE-family HTH domain